MTDGYSIDLCISAIYSFLLRVCFFGTGIAVEAWTGMDTGNRSAALCIASRYRSVLCTWRLETR